MPTLAEQNCHCGARESIFSYGTGDHMIVVVFVKEVKGNS